MWGLLALVVGLLYGWMKPGRQDRWRLFKTGILVGLVLAIVFALVGALTQTNPFFGLGTGFFDILIAALVITVLFVLGTWLGDLIEGRKRTA